MSYRDKTILVTAVAGDIGAGAVRALLETNIRIIGCDMNSYAPVRESLDALFSVPSAREVDSYLDAVCSLIKGEGVDYLLPISEPEIEVLNSHRDAIPLPRENILMNNQVILDNFLDKLLTNHYLAALDIPVPKTAMLSEYNDDWPFPLVVKSRRGYGSKKLWQIEDCTDLEYLRKKDDGSLIVQECLGSLEAEFTTGVFSNGTDISVISFRRRLGFGGLSVEAVLDNRPGIDELAHCVAAATGLVGSINIQTRQEGDQFYPFEINPRLSSTILFRKYFGFNDAVWWLHTAAGRKYAYHQRYRGGRAIRYTSEYYADLVEMDQ